MARGKKTGGRNFKSGESGNPNGRPPLPTELRRARELNREELERILNEYLFRSMPEIKVKMAEVGTPAIELIVGSLIVEAAKRGDPNRISFLIDRFVARPAKISMASDSESFHAKIVAALDKIEDDRWD